MKHVVIDARIIDHTSGRYAVGLVGELMKLPADFRYSVLVPKNSREMKNMQASDSAKNVSFIECDIPLFSKKEQFALPRLLKKLKPDLVHFTFQQTALGYRGKTMVTVHDLTQLNFNKSIGNRALHSFKRRLLRESIRRSIKHAEKVLVPTNYAKKELLSTFAVPPIKVVVTYESGEGSPIKNTTPLPYLQNHKFILYVGNARDHKNLHTLLQAFIQLTSNYPTLRLVLVGKKDAYYQNLEAYALKKQIENVVFTDFVSNEELGWLYKNALAYVFPSLSEGFGLPGLEAMTYGLPVASSNATCLPEVYGDAAHYFDPKNPIEMAQAIRDVIQDERLRGRLVKSGHELLKRYSWSKMTKETVAVYKQILG